MLTYFKHHSLAFYNPENKFLTEEIMGSLDFVCLTSMSMFIASFRDTRVSNTTETRRTLYTMCIHQKCFI